MSIDYIKSNKEAWEEAFEESTESFRVQTIDRLKNDPKSMFTYELRTILESDASNQKTLAHFCCKKTLAHFCCNNGRETNASLAFGYQSVVGFDIAENMITFANQVAIDLKLNARFHATNILTIDPSYHHMFDTIMFTVGAITWFKDPKELFLVVSQCLKPGGRLIIEDLHPFCNQLATSSEEGYDPKDPKKLVINYFKSTPWIEQSSMGYMTGKSEGTKTFYSYSHTLTTLFTGMIDNGLIIESFSENQVCQANLFPHLNHSGIPLTYVLTARKK